MIKIMFLYLFTSFQQYLLLFFFIKGRTEDLDKCIPDPIYFLKKIESDPWKSNTDPQPC